MLHNTFVIACIYKASGDVAFVCQSHYPEILINELDLNNVSIIKTTYMKVIKPKGNILSDNTLFFKNKFNVAVTEFNKKLFNL